MAAPTASLHFVRIVCKVTVNRLQLSRNLFPIFSERLWCAEHWKQRDKSLMLYTQPSVSNVNIEL